MSPEMIWTVCLLMTHFAFYYMGKHSKTLDNEAQLELEKFKYEKYYEHERWKAERNKKND